MAARKRKALHILEDFDIDESSEEECGSNVDDNDLAAQGFDELFGETKVDTFDLKYPKPTKRNYRYKWTIPDSLINADETGVEIIKREFENHFLRWRFGGRLRIEEIALIGHGIPDLEVKKTVNGKKYSLVASKLVKKKCASGFNKFDPNVAKVYYVAENGKCSIKKEMELLGSFQDLEACKVASRMELAVSPVISLHNHPLQFQLDSSKFELISERGNDGCGFAPPEFFIHFLGSNDGRRYCALQVRIFSPVIGWAKGMLVKKLGINKIQLPPSMIKVQKSTCFLKRVEKWVYVGIRQYFPSRACEMTARSFNPHLPDPPASYLKSESRGLGAMYKHLLVSNGVSEEMVEAYERTSKTWIGRDHCACVGVADPTSSIPKGMVFLSGFGVVSGKGNDGMSSQVFVTRFPCTSYEDGVLLESIHCKPAKMKKEDWDFLASLPFGLIIFSRRGNIPKLVADGDLDGDLYRVCWNLRMVAEIERFKKYIDIGKTKETKKDCLEGTRVSVDGKDAIVLHRGEDNQYIVAVGKHFASLSAQEILGDREFVESILNHRGEGKNLEVLLKWANGGETWKRLGDVKYDLVQSLAEYALSKDLLNEGDWKWCNCHIRDAVPFEILSHKKVDGKLYLSIRWDDGTSTLEPLNCLSDEAMPLLVTYATSKNLIFKGEWHQVKEFQAAQKKDWFDRAQRNMCRLQLLRDQDRLTTNLHSAYKKVATQGIDERLSQELGQAFKESIDIRKHGGKIHLRPELLTQIREKSLHQYFI